MIGIRDDADNRFKFPREEHLTKRLKDVLEDEVDEKYFLSNDGIKNLLKNQEYNKFNPLDNNSFTTNVITSRVNKISNDNPFIKVGTWRTHNDGRGFREIEDGSCPTIPARAREDGSGQPVININYKIRRLTPRECFRLMDFPDTFTWPVSDSQAYKQAGNSIVVNVLYKILKQLPI